MSKKHLFLTVLIFSLLLQTSTNIAKAQNISQELIVAAKSNNLKKIKQLIKKGADVNSEDENGATVLMWAVYKSDLSLVKFLVENKADFTKKGLIYITEDKSAYYGNLIAIAVAENKFKILKYLIEECNIDIDDKEYYTETQTDNGWTGLQWAAYKGKIEIAEYLINKGANINANHLADKTTPLIYALQNQKDETAKFLINKGADVNIQNYYKWTAIHYAARRGNDEIVELLLENSANPNLQTEDGYTPLMLAAYNNNFKTCIYLVENHADKTLKHNSGKIIADW